jgi:hypothetical protein
LRWRLSLIGRGGIARRLGLRQGLENCSEHYRNNKKHGSAHLHLVKLP